MPSLNLEKELWSRGLSRVEGVSRRAMDALRAIEPADILMHPYDAADRLRTEHLRWPRDPKTDTPIR